MESYFEFRAPNIYNKTETDNMLNQKVNTSGGTIQGELGAYVFRCGQMIIKNDDDLNCLSLIQLTENESIIDLRTEESFAYMYFRIKGTSFIRLSTTTGYDNITLFKDTNINGNNVITGRLDVGLNPDTNNNWISIHSDNSNNNGPVGLMQFQVWGGKNGVWNITSANTPDVKIEIKLDGNLFMKFFNNNNEIRHYKTLANSSDYRLKENEELIENVCETSPKLRPQLYDKKPDMENDDPTKWYK